MAGAHRRELLLDGSEPYWLIPRERMKGRTGKRREHLIPLTPLAVELFREALALAGHSQFVIPHAAKPTSPMRADSMTQAMQRLSERLRKVALENDPRALEFAERATPHALRKTSSDTMQKLGVEPHHVKAVLGHVDGSAMGRHYTESSRWLLAPQKRAALLKLEQHIRKVCGLPQA